MSQCSSYHTETGEARCWGTREMDPCSCGGDQRHCSFYPELRERAERDVIRMNRTLPQQLRAAEAGYKRMAPQMRSLIHQAASEIERMQAALDEKVGEIVRCRECEHYDCEDGDQKCVKDAEWDEETACYYGFVSYHGPEFYCADGKRRDGGQDG